MDLFIITVVCVLLLIAYYDDLKNWIKQPVDEPQSKTTSFSYDPYILQEQFIKDLNSKHEMKKELDKHELSQFLVYKANYLKSAKWKDLRQYRLSLDNYQCVICESTHSLNTHHLHYRTLGRESITDIITLCEQCHTERHERIGYPQTVAEYLLFNDTLV